MGTVKSIEEIWMVALKTSGTTLSALIGKDVIINNIEREDIEKIKSSISDRSYIVVSTDINELGRLIFLLDGDVALLIASLMMGEETPLKEFNELSMSALSEAFSQMIGTITLSLSEVMKKKLQITPTELRLLDDKYREIIFNKDVTCFRYLFKIDGQPDSELFQFIGKDSEEKLLPRVSAVAPDLQLKNTTDNNPKLEGTSSVQPVNFQPLVASKPKEPASNLDLLIDVPIQVSVELGRTKMLIKDILVLSPGSIIELEKLAGEPVDILANGKLIAKGEVVVIDENFGVRITEILNPEKKMEDENG
ncbi:MAG: flagellar motor switch protein FliN [bacterium]